MVFLAAPLWRARSSTEAQMFAARISVWAEMPTPTGSAEWPWRKCGGGACAVAKLNGAGPRGGGVVGRAPMGLTESSGNGAL